MYMHNNRQKELKYEQNKILNIRRLEPGASKVEQLMHHLVEWPLTSVGKDPAAKQAIYHQNIDSNKFRIITAALKSSVRSRQIRSFKPGYTLSLQVHTARGKLS